jgi:uncharacterized ubiquitin-like protein YukD
MKLPIYYTVKDVIKQVWEFEKVKIELPVQDDLFKLSWKEVFKDRVLDDKTVDDFKDRFKLFMSVSIVPQVYVIEKINVDMSLTYLNILSTIYYSSYGIVATIEEAKSIVENGGVTTLDLSENGIHNKQTLRYFRLPVIQ